MPDNRWRSVESMSDRPPGALRHPVHAPRFLPGGPLSRGEGNDEMCSAQPERARWPRVDRPPHPALREVIARDYAGFTEDTAPRHLVLPATTSVSLIVKICDSERRPPAFVMGAHGAHTVVEGECAPSYLEVRLAPLGAYTLLGLPIDELGGQPVDLVDVVGAAGRRLVEQLRAVPTWPQRFDLVDELLLGRVQHGTRPAPEVRQAWQRLITTGGAAPIGRIADEVGWSHKHLISTFRRQVGLRPKTVARLVRLDRVWRRLDERRPVRWEQIATDTGYADQAHLVRDFREFTGMSPTEFQSRMPGGREVNSVQDRAAARP
jgi:AraC-like DNA-binding protein